MKINIEDIEKHMEFRKKINNAELEDIEFYENKGGENSYKNCQLTCVQCNYDKNKEHQLNN